MQVRQLVFGAALSALLPVLLPIGANAVTEQNFNAKTTEDLVALCSAKATDAMGTAALNFCHGYAQGAVSVELEREAAAHQSKLFCFPSPTPSRTVTLEEFVKWANANPSHMSDRPADGLFAFFGERFPCARK
jgi:Rap1a immunity proteins